MKMKDNAVKDQYACFRVKVIVPQNTKDYTVFGGSFFSFMFDVLRIFSLSTHAARAVDLTFMQNEALPFQGEIAGEALEALEVPLHVLKHHHL
jgi:hypothetical protein